MKIRLLANWMDNKKGATLNLNESVARTLVSRKTAVEVIEKEISHPPENKMQKKEQSK